MEPTKIAVPVSSLKFPQGVKELTTFIAKLTAEHGDELTVHQYGSHLVVFTEGERCSCSECLTSIDAVIDSFYSVAGAGMILCSSCGNKRCPHAYSHKYVCTGSNEWDQKFELRPEYRNESASQ